jgi:hypothetical protein
VIITEHQDKELVIINYFLRLGRIAGMALERMRQKSLDLFSKQAVT